MIYIQEKSKALKKYQSKYNDVLSKDYANQYIKIMIR